MSRVASVDDLRVGPWGARFKGRHFPCAHGRNGIGATKHEGDWITPEGSYRLLSLYYRADRRALPQTPLRAHPLGPQQGWSEDPADPAYNASITHPHDFAADRMARGDRLYDLCVVTDQNIAREPGKGSAIFVHIWRKPRHPTAGCISFRACDLEWILKRWTPWSRLVIKDRGGL